MPLLCRYILPHLDMPHHVSPCLVMPRYASSCLDMPHHAPPFLPMPHPSLHMPRPKPLSMISRSLTARSPPRPISIVAPPYFSPALHHIVKPRQIKHCWPQRPIKPVYTNLSYQSQPAYPTPTPVNRLSSLTPHTMPPPLPQHTPHS